MFLVSKTVWLINFLLFVLPEGCHRAFRYYTGWRLAKITDLGGVVSFRWTKQYPLPDPNIICAETMER